MNTHVPCAIVRRTIGIWIITDVREYSSPMCYSPANNRYIVYYWLIPDSSEYSSPMCYSPVDNTYMVYVSDGAYSGPMRYGPADNSI